MTLPTPPEEKDYLCLRRTVLCCNPPSTEREATILSKADALIAARTKQAEELGVDLTKLREDYVTLLEANGRTLRQIHAERQARGKAEEDCRILEAENTRLRAKLDDAARFVNPFRLGRDRPSSAETRAEVLAGLERRATHNEIPTTDTEENTMSRQGGG